MIRSLRYRGRTRPDLPDGCPEQFDWGFFRWIWQTRRTAPARIERFVAAAPQNKRVIRLASADGVRAFLQDLERQSR